LGLTKEDIAKVPKGLSLKEYYTRIYNWHKKNKDKIFTKLSGRRKDDPYILCYLELIKIIPEPSIASPEDIVFICEEVITGLMEWAYHEKDEDNVKMAAYAHYILNTFFNGSTKLSRNSKLYPKYKASSCLEKYRNK
jgi:hypothetical protein